MAAMQEAIAELLLLRATDRRRTTSKLSRAMALATKEGSLHGIAAARYLAASRATTHMYLADNFLWLAFVQACDDDRPTMADVLANVLGVNPVRGGCEVYLIPNARVWCTQHFGM